MTFAFAFLVVGESISLIFKLKVTSFQRLEKSSQSAEYYTDRVSNLERERLEPP